MAEKKAMTAGDKVRIGDMVYFYIGGYIGDTPMPGMVIDKFNDMLTLAVWSGGQWREKQRVHHKDSDFIKNYPPQALKLGMWDFRGPAPALPEFPEPSAPIVPPAQSNQGSPKKNSLPV